MKSKIVYKILFAAILIGGLFVSFRPVHAILPGECKGKYDFSFDIPSTVSADGTFKITARFSWNTAVGTDCLNYPIVFEATYLDKDGKQVAITKKSAGTASPQGKVVSAVFSVKPSSLSGLAALTDGAYIVFRVSVGDNLSYFEKKEATVTISSSAAAPPGNQPPGNQPPTQGGGATSTGTFTIEPVGPADFTELVNTIAKWIFNISIPIAIIMIIYAGIRMLLAQGDPGKFAKARDILKYAVLGLVVIFIGKGFISLIKSILTLGSGN